MRDTGANQTSDSARRALDRRDAEQRAMRRRRMRTLGIGAAVAVVLAGGIAVLEAVRPDARGAVVAHLEAIAAGDAAAANAVLADGAERPDDDSLAGTTTITDVRVADGSERVRRDGPDGAPIDVERFEVRFELSGDDHRVDVDVEHVGGWWLAEEWRVVSSMAQRVDVAASAVGPVEVRIGETAVEPTAPFTTLLLYPAGYEVQPVDGPVWTGVPTALDVRLDSEIVQPEVEPTDEVLDGYVAAATESIDTCVARATAILDCITADAIPDAPAGVAVAWRVEQPPILADPEPGWTRTATAVVIAAYADAAGGLVEQRFTMTGTVGAVSIAGDEVTPIVTWTSATT